MDQKTDTATLGGTIKELEAALHRNPYDHNARLLLARKIAEKSPSQALELLDHQPTSGEPPIDMNLFRAELLLTTRRYIDAKIEAKSIAGSLNSDQIHRLAIIFKRLGDIRAQNHLLNVLRKSNVITPQGQLDLAESEVFLGNVVNAKEIYKAHIGNFPDSQKAYFEYARLIQNDNDGLERAIRGTIDRLNGRQTNTVFLWYALGKLLEDKGDYNEAFMCYSTAGTQAKAHSNYDVRNDLDCIHQVIASSRPGSPPSGPKEVNASRPIFVVGLPRSGTTLVERFIGSHKSVTSINETYFFQVAMQLSANLSPQALPDPKKLEIMLTGDMQAVASQYLDLTSHLRTQSDWFIEKLPENVLYLDGIFRAFNRAKVFLLLRNPLDNCLALYKQPYFRFAYTLEDLAQYYCAYHQMILHWQKVFGERIKIIHYEDLVTRPNDTFKAVAEHLGLEFDLEKIDLLANSIPSTSASSAQVKESIHSRSLHLWSKYQDQLSPLFETLRQANVIDSLGDPIYDFEN